MNLMTLEHEARYEGLLAGRQEGIRQTKLETAAALKHMGIPVEQIMQATGLCKEEIDAC